MLKNASDLTGFEIRAKDGPLGTVDQLYFDDETWAIRYLTVETGGWLGGRQVLISPYSILETDFEGKRVDVALTKKQVENSPGIDTRLPVSRQHEAEFLGYYGYPYYWGGPYLWGPAFYPVGLEAPAVSMEAVADRVRRESADSHLRSTKAVTGYYIEAADGEIGHVNGFVVDDEAWVIRYLEVATRNWWPGKLDGLQSLRRTYPRRHQDGARVCRNHADHARVRKPAPSSLRPSALLAARRRTPAFVIVERRLDSLWGRTCSEEQGSPLRFRPQPGFVGGFQMPQRRTLGR
jgi:hypothetical protein